LINSSGHLQAGKFLENFPGLQFLTMRGIRLDAFPVETFQMRRLTVLSLDSCNLRLSEATAEGLAHMEGLEELDLRNNPLEIAPNVGHMKNLEELRLSRTDLQEVPAGLFELEKLRYADLSGNRIMKLPNELFEVDDVRKVTYNFRDNPLSESSRENIAAYDENSSLDRHVLIQFDDGLDLSSDSESGSDTESDDSGVGSSSEVSDDEFIVG
jgi:Leucine-rich repeat (LRR) protein